MTNWEYYFATPEKTARMSISFEPDESFTDDTWSREGVLCVSDDSHSVVEIDIWDTSEIEPSLLQWLKAEKRPDNETEVIHNYPWLSYKDSFISY